MCIYNRKLSSEADYEVIREIEEALMKNDRDFIKEEIRKRTEKIEASVTLNDEGTAVLSKDVGIPFEVSPEKTEAFLKNGKENSGTLDKAIKRIEDRMKK